MVIEKRFVELKNPRRGFISHDDQNIYGLRFRVFYQDNNVAYYIVKGEDNEIDDYMSRFGPDIKELSDTEMQSNMDIKAPEKDIPCDMCDGTGIMNIPRFDLAKSKLVFE